MRVLTFGLSQFFNFAAFSTVHGAEAIVAAFIIGALLAGIVKALFHLGILIGLLVAVLVVLGVVSLDLPAGNGISLTSVYALSSSIWGFLAQFAKAISAVFAAGGVDGALAGIAGFALSWFGLGFLPLRRKD